MFTQSYPKVILLIIFFGGFCFWGGYLLHAQRTQQTDLPHTTRLNSTNYTFINPLLDFHPALSPLQKKDVNLLTKKLENVIEKNTEARKIKKASVYYRDLKNGPWILLNGEERYTPASLFKVPTMISLFKLAEANPALLQENISYTQDYSWVPTHEFANTTNPLTPGESYSIDYLIEKMIIDSDNISTLLLQERFGKKYSEQLLTEFNLPLPGLLDAYEAFITIRDYASFFRILYNATYLSEHYSNKALEHLSRTTFAEGIKAVAPRDSTVSNKFGIYTIDKDNMQIHDCGIVYHGNQNYIVCIMTRGNDVNDMLSTIKEIASTIFDFKRETL